ncbi:hypothetical protein GN958_ATG11304 [Phytophthora infestans]|uniref:EF-hand domain-containing protein n=1 Tax=Phytophthora infestans TaxID=4787 RepID=A0A8S9UFU7_PHYIN|nr:hypothetical protein GN958_ATG11304 [Phytophthora infestans]
MDRSRKNPGRSKSKDGLKITPALIDVSIPSPNAPHFGDKSTPMMSTMVNMSQNPPLRKPAATNFMDSSKFVTATTHAMGNCRSHNRRSRRRRANVDAMMCSNMVRQSLTLSASSVSSNSSAAHKNCRVAPPAGKNDMYGPPPGSDVVTVPIPGDCNFEQQYNVAMSMDEKAFTPMEKLEALRDAMGNFTDKDGYIERETFSQAFEVDGDEFDGYATSTVTIDGNAILIDAVMKLGVGVNAQEKLRFIFDTLDPDNTGYVVEEQIVQLLESNFSSAKIDVVGMEFRTVAKLMFRKARVQNDAMTFKQFCGVFEPYVTPRRSKTGVRSPHSTQE